MTFIEFIIWDFVMRTIIEILMNNSDGYCYEIS